MGLHLKMLTWNISLKWWWAVFESYVVRNIVDGDNGGIYIAGDGIGSSVVLDSLGV